MFYKLNVTRVIDAAGFKVKTFVSRFGGGIPQKEARSGTRVELRGRVGAKPRIAETPKGFEFGVVGGATIH